MLKKALAIMALACAVAIPAAAQDQAPANPLATALKNLYNGNKNNILHAAEKMPEENYGMRPGQQEEVRTFGQHLGHIANFMYLWCSQSRGEKNPNAGKNLEKLNTKAEFLKAAQDAFAYCDEAYNSATDASLMQMVDITQENGRQTRNLRGFLLMLNYGHNNEIWGNIVTYMRIKNIVPTDPRPPQR